MKTVRRSRLWTLAAGMLLVGVGVMTSCSDKYDLDEREPAGFGSSIYGWLNENGNFTNTVRLIEDLGHREELSKTGSKTLFAADDAAFERFYQNNAWGVRSYDQLTLAQKKLLLRGSMIDNSIQVNSLSTIEGEPLREGQCMRRFTSLDEFDSVPVLKPEDMPVNKYWARHIKSGKEMVCLEDGSSVPMLLFLQAQMTNNKVTNEDYNFLFNNTVSREDGDASVNGIKVIQQNVRCGNGFIHVTQDVVTPLPNMAEMIEAKRKVNGDSIFLKLLQRFCAPYPDGKDRSTTIRYNDIYEKNIDTIYTKRYINDKRGEEITKTPDGGIVIDEDLGIHLPCLRFDPEWNAYYAASNKNANEGNVAEQRDMAVMMVPTDKAMMEYWNGIGKPLSANFASWDDVDDETIVELLRLNMLPSFLSSVPSKFDGVLNDANDPMGLTTADVDSVWMCCNGAVYQTNKVFSPTAYVCVSFPALVDKNMRIMKWAIEQNKYNNYLKALGTTYSFFIPDNNALDCYIDPCSFGKPTLQMLSFHWDDAKGISADIYNFDPTTYDPSLPIADQRVYVETTYDTDRLRDCLKDILDTHIVMGNIWDGKHTYYRTKNGTGIRVKNATNWSTMTVEGSYQMYDIPQPLTISKEWDQRKEVTGGNGKTYVLHDQPIMGTSKTVLDQLEAHPSYFQEFHDLLQGSALASRTYNTGTGQPKDNKACGGENIILFNTYHYTIFAPSNTAIQNLKAAGKLPADGWQTVVDKRNAGNVLGAAEDSLKIVDFLRYHIQDNALYIGAENETGDYETSLIDNANHRFYTLHSELKDNKITVTDGAGVAHTVSNVNLDGTSELFNIQAREYIYEGTDAVNATRLYTTSSAVIHLIDNDETLSWQ